MIITLSGITGAGKSFFKNKIVKELNVKNLVIVTTRKIRKTEKEGIDKYFVNKNQFFKMKKEGTIISDFRFLDEYYAYMTKDFKNKENQVSELHYEAIDIFKNNVKDSFCIYMIPKDLSRAKEELIKRKLPKEIEEKRLEEINEQIFKFQNDKKIRDKFDYIFENDYTEESTKILLDIIKRKIMGEEI